MPLSCHHLSASGRRPSDSRCYPRAEHPLEAALTPVAALAVVEGEQAVVVAVAPQRVAVVLAVEAVRMAEAALAEAAQLVARRQAGLAMAAAEVAEVAQAGLLELLVQRVRLPAVRKK